MKTQTWVCVLPILTISLNSSDLARRALCNFFIPGRRISLTVWPTAMCIAVGNVSLELLKIKIKRFTGWIFIVNVYDFENL